MTSQRRALGLEAQSDPGVGGAKRPLEVVLLGHHSVAERFTYGYGLARLHAHAVARNVPARITVHDRPADGDEDEDLERIRAHDPDVVGLGAYLWSLPRIARLVDRLRRELPRSLIVVGGPSALGYAAVAPDLARPHYLMVGEAEESFASLLAAHAAGELAARGAAIAGLLPGDRDAPAVGSVAAPAHLAELGSPYLMGLSQPPGDTFYLETSRGCPHRCGFCIASTRPGGLRWFPLDRLRDELAWALERDLRTVNLCDAALNYRSDRLADVTGLFREVDPDRRLGFTFALHADYLDDQQIGLLQRIRIEQATLGLNSITPSTFADVGRKLVPARFAGAVDRLSRITRPVVSLVLGLPGETVTGFAETLAFAATLAADVEIFELKVIPETRYFERAAELGLVFDPGDQMTVVSSASFDPDALDQMRQLAAAFQAERGRWRQEHLVGAHPITSGLLGRLRRLLGGLGALDLDGSAVAAWQPAPGWQLVGIDAERSHGVVSLDFDHEGSGERVTLWIGPRNPTGRSFATTDHFDLGYPVAASGPPSPAAMLFLRELCRQLAAAD